MAVRDRLPTRMKSAVAPLIERAFWNDRLTDADGRPASVGLASRPVVALNRALFERGIAPFWVGTPDAVAAYWASRSEAAEENEPQLYATKSLEVVRFLNDFWSPEIRPTDSVLEVGCNAGPNLEGLRQLGFRDLAGVEINRHAIDEMRRAFPQLSSMVTVHEGSAQDVLPTLQESSRDVVFSMAVLLHVHPKSNSVMKEMVRISRRYVCVMEAEDVTCGYVFARNYRRVFERLGCTEVKTAPVLRESYPQAGAVGYVGYRVRLFRVPGVSRDAPHCGNRD